MLLLVAPAFALFHLPFPFLEAPQGITLALVPVALVQMVVIGIVALFLRPLIMWLYNGSGRIAVVAVVAVVVAVLTKGRLGYESQRAAGLTEAGRAEAQPRVR
jgi:hypothetical protein